MKTYKYDGKDLILKNSKSIEGVISAVVKPEEFDEVKELGKKMIEFAVANGGLGLAAIQVGIPLNMFVFMVKQNQFQIVINPKIFSVDNKKTNVVEACLSYPDEQYFLRRNKNVRVRYEIFQDGKFRNIFKNLTGQPSFVFQHEFDHLSGQTIHLKGENFSVNLKETGGAEIEQD